MSASHTMPVTVAAEQGLIGLAAYLAVVAAALLTLFGDRAFRAARTPGGASGLRVARAALAAMFVALLVHTMVYAAFLEDPFTWVILAAGAALAPLAQLTEERVRAPAPLRGVGAGTGLMTDFLRRLASTGAAYTASSVISKLFAVALLPLYTRHLTRADYGAAEVLLAAVVALSIFFRLGIIEALLRFYYERRGGTRRPIRKRIGRLRRDEVVRSSVGFLLIAITSGRCWSRRLPGRCRRRCSTAATPS